MTQDALIKFKPDFTLHDKSCQTQTFQLMIGVSRQNFILYKSDGKSAEQLMEETSEGLDEYMELLATAPVGLEKFRLLTTCLYGEAKKLFKQVVAAHYATDVLKTNDNFEQAKKDLITELSNHPYPGNDQEY